MMLNFVVEMLHSEYLLSLRGMQTMIIKHIIFVRSLNLTMYNFLNWVNGGICSMPFLFYKDETMNTIVVLN